MLMKEVLFSWCRKKLQTNSPASTGRNCCYLGKETCWGGAHRNRKQTRSKSLLFPTPLMPPIGRVWYRSIWLNIYLSQRPSPSNTEYIERWGLEVRGNNLRNGTGRINIKRNLLKCNTCGFENEIKEAKISNMGQISHLLKKKL